MRDEALDRAIDAIARDMTAGEPGADLRARVTGRLRPGSGRRAPSRSIWSVAIATAAIVLIALVAHRTTRPPVALQSVRLPSVQLMPDTTYAPGARVAVVQPFRAAPAPRRIAIPPSPIDALAPPPLVVSAIATDDVAVSSIDVPPLDPIAPIEIAPLGEGDRR